MFFGIPRSILVWGLIILGTFSGCGGEGGGGGASSSGDGGGGTPPSSKTLSWVPPDSYTGNTSLNPFTDLAGYEIYVNESGTFTDADAPKVFVRAVDDVTHTLITTYNLANLAPPLSRGVVYRVSMRAVSVTGAKSAFSYPAPFFSF